MKKVYLVTPTYKGIEGYDFSVDIEFPTEREARKYGDLNYPGIYEVEEVVENRKLLYIDIMGRIPYGTKFRFELDKKTFKTISFCEDEELPYLDCIYSYWIRKGFILPYLRPMFSMTEEERNEYLSIKMQETERVALAEVYRPEAISEIMGWLNAHHFDYRGLIEKGLAIEAPENIHKDEKKI